MKKVCNPIDHINNWSKILNKWQCLNPFPGLVDIFDGSSIMFFLWYAPLSVVIHPLYNPYLTVKKFQILFFFLLFINISKFLLDG